MAKSFFGSGVQSAMQAVVGWMAADNPGIIPFYFGYEVLMTNRDMNTLVEIGEYLVGYAANKLGKGQSLASTIGEITNIPQTLAGSITGA